MSAPEARKDMVEEEIIAEVTATEPVEKVATPETQVPPPETDEPSWFVRTYERATAEEMAQRYQQTYDETISQPTFATPRPEAYDAYQRRLEERFRMAQTMADPTHAAAPLRPQPYATTPRRPMRAPFAPRAQGKREITSGRMGMFAITAFTLLACSVGGAGGYVIANPGTLASVASGPSVVFSGLYAKLMTPAVVEEANTTINKVLPVARIDVSDVSGPVNGPIPLSIATFPVNAETPIAVRISGLPPEAYLTKGVHIAEGAWLVKSAEIARAELVVPKSISGNLGLEVAALDEKTGLEAAPPKQMNVALDLTAIPLPGAVPPPEQLTQQMVEPPSDVRVEPVSAEPDQGFNRTASESQTVVPVPLETINTEAMKLISKGRMLLKNGDLISARQYFLKAHALKIPEAAYYVGQTYDPATFNALRVVGLQPDAQLASEWYGKAAAQGVDAANDALTKLSAK